MDRFSSFTKSLFSLIILPLFTLLSFNLVYAQEIVIAPEETVAEYWLGVDPQNGFPGPSKFASRLLSKSPRPSLCINLTFKISPEGKVENESVHLLKYYSDDGSEEFKQQAFIEAKSIVTRPAYWRSETKLQASKSNTDNLAVRTNFIFVYDRFINTKLDNRDSMAKERAALKQNCKVDLDEQVKLLGIKDAGALNTKDVRNALSAKELAKRDKKLQQMSLHCKRLNDGGVHLQTNNPFNKVYADCDCFDQVLSDWYPKGLPRYPGTLRDAFEIAIHKCKDNKTNDATSL